MIATRTHRPTPPFLVITILQSSHFQYLTSDVFYVFLNINKLKTVNSTNICLSLTFKNNVYLPVSNVGGSNNIQQ